MEGSSSIEDRSSMEGRTNIDRKSDREDNNSLMKINNHMGGSRMEDSSTIDNNMEDNSMKKIKTEDRGNMKSSLAILTREDI